MPSTSPDPITLASKSYAALRYEGVPPPRARAALGLAEAAADHLERLFQARPGGGDDPMRPRFARHEAHVRAVMLQGGYPALPEPCRRGRRR
ncbi:MAG: hypothetical protein ABW360_01665 [Phenylobacterium sp.]